MRLAIIPARGGSKRIPRKNVRPFCGKPMIAWSIAAAMESECFDSIVVSTDDPEIAEIARAHGADVPFLRPAELADDKTATVPVIAHAIQRHLTEGKVVTEACCIYATAAFVTAADLRLGYETLKSSGRSYAISVTSFPSPIQRALRLTPDNCLEMFQPEHMATRSQDLEDAYHDAAQFYWGHAEAFLSQQPLFSTGKAAPVLLPRHRVQDVDTPEDWERAELLFKLLQQRQDA